MKNNMNFVLIFIGIFATISGFCYPLLISTYSPYYASIAKNIVLSDNFANLTLLNADWLDKPHFPFWMTALSFKIFGINAFAYILPGFIFHLIGAIYTFKIAKYWYSKEVGLLAVVIYCSALHLMLSAIDVRAEAYLLGSIIPACYFILCYDQKFSVRSLILSALFIAIALMSKGIFVVITILSGILVIWILTKRLYNLCSIKWLSLVLLSLLFISPELIALYLQFDLHPEKLIFGKQGVSGIKWFFWDSQFGRFFNTGPIMVTTKDPFHWIFFIHTFLWAFLPWWPIFFLVLYKLIKQKVNHHKLSLAENYLLFSFLITFIVFSSTSFQVDHYTNIIFPFACILCANFLYNNKFSQIEFKILFWIELVVSALLLIVALILTLLLLPIIAKIVSLIFLLSILFAFYMLFKKNNNLCLIYTLPTCSIAYLFMVLMYINGAIYVKYDAGYQIAKYVNLNHYTKVGGYEIDLMSLNFYLKPQYIYVRNVNDLKILKNGYLVIQNKDFLKIKDMFPQTRVIKHFYGCRIETFLQNIIHIDKLDQQLSDYILLEIK